MFLRQRCNLYLFDASVFRPPTAGVQSVVAGSIIVVQQYAFAYWWLVAERGLIAENDLRLWKCFFLQVESSSITTRNGAIQREMQDAYRKLICANVERKVRRERERTDKRGRDVRYSVDVLANKFSLSRCNY